MNGQLELSVTAVAVPKKQEHSAGLLMFKFDEQGTLKVFLVHPGGPHWQNKDKEAWSIPKGLVDPGEEVLDTAKREFREETSFDPSEPYYPLGEVVQKSGKIVTAWAFQGSYDPDTMKSNEIEIDWPRGSETKITIPEVDKGNYFTIEEAKDKINPRQAPLLERLRILICAD